MCSIWGAPVIWWGCLYSLLECPYFLVEFPYRVVGLPLIFDKLSLYSVMCQSCLIVSLLFVSIFSDVDRLFDSIYISFGEVPLLIDGGQTGMLGCVTIV